MNAEPRDIMRLNDPATSPLVPVDNSGALMQAICKAAADPHVDVEKVDRLLAMFERIQDRSAKIAFDAELAKMQPKLPTIDRNGLITATKKDNPNQVIHKTPYALWEDINEAIRPILAEHGFSLSFRTGLAADGKITVTAILAHAGHREDTTMTLMHDSSGSKNSVQAIASSMSYGKRYTAILLLNISSRAPQEVDDDGNAAGKSTIDRITGDQLGELHALIDSVGADKGRFLRFMNIESLSDLPTKRYQEAIANLNRKAARP